MMASFENYDPYQMPCLNVVRMAKISRVQKLSLQNNVAALPLRIHYPTPEITLL